MANIGTFTADKDGYTGTIRTLTLNVKVKLVPNDKGSSENAPDFRLQAASHDIGAAWKKTSEAGREYLSVTLDDPTFPATVYARLIEEEDGTHNLISVVVKESVASEVIQATCFSGSATVTWSSRSGLSDTVPIGVQLRVLPLHRAGLASRAA